MWPFWKRDWAGDGVDLSPSPFACLIPGLRYRVDDPSAYEAERRVTTRTMYAHRAEGTTVLFSAGAPVAYEVIGAGAAVTWRSSEPAGGRAGESEPAADLRARGLPHEDGRRDSWICEEQRLLTPQQCTICYARGFAGAEELAAVANSAARGTRRIKVETLCLRDRHDYVDRNGCQWHVQRAERARGGPPVWVMYEVGASILFEVRADGSRRGWAAGAATDVDTRVKLADMARFTIDELRLMPAEEMPRLRSLLGAIRWKRHGSDRGRT